MEKLSKGSDRHNPDLKTKLIGDKVKDFVLQLFLKKEQNRVFCCKSITPSELSYCLFNVPGSAAKTDDFCVV